MNKAALLLVLLLLAILSSLLNSSLLGPVSLPAYFGFTLLSSCFAIGTFGSLILRKTKVNIRLPVPILVFSFLSIYIYIHGIAQANTGLTHYYWIACALWLLASTLLQQGAGGHDYTRYYPVIRYGILAISCLESIVVWLQWTGIAPSKDPLFRCTGTWVNPNVTAMFLALSLFTVFQLLLAAKKKNPDEKKWIYPALLLIITAIALLRCRTAYLVTILLIAGQYLPAARAFFSKRSAIGKAGLLLTTVPVILLLLALLAFKVKPASSEGRIDVWKNSLPLIATAPFIGHGFGLFEKEYNLFAASNRLPGRGHVYMAYNDFIELAVQGGWIAVLCWTGFMISLLRYNIRHNLSVLPVLSFLIIQLTNFGIQAIPVFALFLLYTGFDNFETGQAAAGSFTLRPFTLRPALALPCLAIAGLLLFYQASLANAFYKRTAVGNDLDATDAADAYRELRGTLDGYQSYNESYGDVFLQLKKYDLALQQYLKAAKGCSVPAVLTKCGYCYQQQQQYQECEYYYELVQNMQPYQLAPRMSLLNLYRLKGDSAKMYDKAREIVTMPVKNASDQTEMILAYARNIINVRNQNHLPIDETIAK